ncbi:hypothetical protein ACUN24_21580 [Pedobacter sp. WC2501]
MLLLKTEGNKILACVKGDMQSNNARRSIDINLWALIFNLFFDD